MPSDIALTIIVLGLWGLIAYIIRKDYVNEQDFRRFHRREIE